MVVELQSSGGRVDGEGDRGSHVVLRFAASSEAGLRLDEPPGLLALSLCLRLSLLFSFGFGTVR